MAISAAGILAAAILEEAAITNCVFCDKLRDLSSLPPDELVWEFKHSVALLGPWQYYHGYCLLVSRSHARELNHLDEDECEAFLDEMCILAMALESVFPLRKLNYELLGNQVPHLHWHLFPRYESDPENLKPVWLALDRAERDEAEKKRLRTGPKSRTETAERIRQQLNQLVGHR